MMVAGRHEEAIQCTLYGAARIKATEPCPTTRSPDQTIAPDTVAP